jgi:hypothetical protein
MVDAHVDITEATWCLLSIARTGRDKSDTLV